MKPYAATTKFLKLFVLDPLQNAMVAAGRVAGFIDFPVPPNSSMRKTGGHTVWAYYIGGLRISLPIATCASQLGVALRQKIKVLDFGCGVGRPLLHLTRMFPAPDYHACDVDDTSIAFIQRNYPQVKSSVSKFSPPLPYETGFFDLIYSVSIFSHLSMEDQSIWLRELSRVTKPGGYVLVSTAGYCNLPYLCRVSGRDEAADRAQLDRDGYIYRAYSWWKESIQREKTLRAASVLIGIDRTYGTTILTADYIRRHWPAAGFDVPAIIEGMVDGQDLVVLRRV